MELIKLKKLLFVFVAILPLSILAQTISGTVKDASGEVLPFANVIEKGTTNGTTSDLDGKFTLRVSILPTTLIINSLGYNEIVLPISTTDNITVSLKDEGVGLDEVMITGNRAKPRTILDSPVPIDNVSAKDLIASGKVTVEEMLTYKIPSYNSSQQTISDATAHFNPADLRGLGPSRTLVLVNGKRKNQSALVYINDTPGKGEVGTDMKSIPAAAVDHIEVLRDGASAQYGSDAIAGVINIILKKNVKHIEANINSGITTEGDGFEIGADINGAITGKKGGFVNYTVGLQYQEHTNRAGTPGGDALFGNLFQPSQEALDNGVITQQEFDNAQNFANSILNGTHPWIQDNPDLGMTVGQPDMKTGEIYLNAELPVKVFNTDVELYGNLGTTLRSGKSFALYRTPYWVSDPNFLLHDEDPNDPTDSNYQGFQPTFETDITDFMVTGGAKYKFLGFDIDASGTFGINSVDYTIGNTINTGLVGDRSTQFEAGGYRFSNLVSNFDISRGFDKVSLIFGAEFKIENFKAVAGEPTSHLSGGAESFPGLTTDNRVNESRNSLGAYVNLDYDVNDDFLIGGAARFENYDDFGNNTSYKINARYKLGSIGAVRGSYSTGFRAPSLHQINLSNIQTLVSGNIISNQATLNNNDDLIRNVLGVPQLKAETSTNISAGITVKPIKNLSIALDYYRVDIDDRVLFTGEIGFREDAGDFDVNGDGSVNGTELLIEVNPIEQILQDDNVANNRDVSSIKFFTNAVNTETQGVDFVVSYNNIHFPKGKLGFNLGLNWNDTKIVDVNNSSEILVENNYDIFNRKEASRIESARPNIKSSLGINYEQEKFTINLNNTYFGEVTWQHAADPLKDQTFGGKVITDVVFGYKISDVVKFNLIVNNALNVYPDEIDTKGDFVTDLGGRFKYPWEVNQFGFLGTKIKAGFNFKF